MYVNPLSNPRNLDLHGPLCNQAHTTSVHPTAQACVPGEENLADEMAGCTVPTESPPPQIVRIGRKRARAADDAGREDTLCAKLVSSCCFADVAGGASGLPDDAGEGLRRSGRVAARIAATSAPAGVSEADDNIVEGVGAVCGGTAAAAAQTACPAGTR